MAPSQVNTLVMPPEKHIPVPKPQLLAALARRLPEADAPQWAELALLMEAVASFDFHDLKQRMRSNFLPFASGAKGQVYLQRNAKGIPTTYKLDHKELEFVSDVFDVLRASHYHLLTDAEWRIATSESFRLNLPLEIDWEYMDAALLSKFWASNEDRAELRRHLPDEMADRILVFHRGVGAAKLKGLLLEEKLDLLVDYTALRVWRALLQFVPKKYGGLKPSKEELDAAKKKQAAAEEAAAAAAATGADPAREARRAELKRQFSTLGGRVTAGGAYVASDHRFAHPVERVTLRRLCPGVLSLLAAFPRTLELQEPTFKELVVVYRRAFPPRKPPAAGADAPSRGKEERMANILERRNVVVKVFGETPMADVELVLPSKRPQVKPFQLVQLAVTIVTALVTGALMLMKAGKDVNMNLVWTAASLVATRCFQVYSSAQAQKAAMQQEMSAQLYDRMQDSQEGVVSVIMEETGDQQFAQIALAYALLLAAGGPLTVDALDTACEDFLSDEFDAKIDFQIADALPRLERWGLVTRAGGEGSDAALVAMPAADAAAMLAAAWGGAYRELGSAHAPGTTTADLLSGRASTFGAGVDAYRVWKAGEALAAAGGGGGGAAKGARSAAAAMFGRAMPRKGMFGSRAGPGGGSGAAADVVDGGGADGGSSGGGDGDGGDGDGKPKKGNIFRRMKQAL